MTGAIPQEWIKQYVDSLLRVALVNPESSLSKAAALRADHAMDLVKAWREHGGDRG